MTGILAHLVGVGGGLGRLGGGTHAPRIEGAQDPGAEGPGLGHPAVGGEAGGGTPHVTREKAFRLPEETILRAEEVTLSRPLS